MLTAADTDLLQAIWTAINAKPRGKAEVLDEACDTALAEGWVPKYAVDDVLHEIHPDLANGEARLLPEALGCEWRNVGRRPSSRMAFAAFDQSLSAPDFTQLLIGLERLGLTVDPSPLVEGLRPEILKARRITQPELAVLWYPRERHRMEPLMLPAKYAGAEAFRIVETETATGYRAAAWFAGVEGCPPVQVMVSKPSLAFRRRVRRTAA